MEVLAEVRRIMIQKWILAPFCSYVTFAKHHHHLGVDRKKADV